MHAGSQSIPEQAALWALRGEDRGGRPTLEIYGRGDTPLQETTISSAVLLADGPPYGALLRVSIPPIPTVVLEPDASVLSLSLTLGHPPGRPGAAASAITVPHRCPRGGLPFAADLAFAGGTSATALVAVPCPPAM